MLARPNKSKIILINPMVYVQDDCLSEGSSAVDNALSLLISVVNVFDCGTIIICNKQGSIESKDLANVSVVIDVDDLSIWKDGRLTSALSDCMTNVIFLGGAWLEEEVMLGAMQGAALGYDMRILVDLSKARHESERSPAFQRLAQHGILTSTVRQMAIEWAAAIDDAAVTDAIRMLLS